MTWVPSANKQRRRHPDFSQLSYQKVCLIMSFLTYELNLLWLWYFIFLESSNPTCKTLYVFSFFDTIEGVSTIWQLVSSFALCSQTTPSISLVLYCSYFFLPVPSVFLLSFRTLCVFSPVFLIFFIYLLFFKIQNVL